MQILPLLLLLLLNVTTTAVQGSH